MVELFTTSGKKAVINAGAFEDAIALQNLLFREAAASGIKAQYDPTKGLFAQSFDMGALLAIMLQLIASDAVQAQAFKCLVKSTYDGEKITRAIFEDEDARGDFYDIMKACIEVNLRPFVKGLFSQLQVLLPTKGPTPTAEGSLN